MKIDSIKLKILEVNFSMIIVNIIDVNILSGYFLSLNNKSNIKKI